ncbi:MAG: DNA-formamidopyrimidine glycosylase family protein, partial [Candidatus Liptonbacteria bacterium]|nr:DNA-formamidopyrimidine glycosylase family protein [Candidatus Liptonbacteria bacterium]
MPELPEVETIVRELDKIITGKTISRFLVYDTKRITKPIIPLPQRVTSVSRHGKYIVCETHGGLRCIVHLRMTGELLYEARSMRHETRSTKHGTRGRKLKADDQKIAHERVRFRFTDGSILRFIDIRRFGTVEWHGRAKSLPSLGIDPLSQNFSPKAFLDLSRGTKRSVKSFLLDQQKIAGIGNIYADEALWHAKIRPTRKAGSLGVAEAGSLVRAIKRVLN